MRRQRSVGSVEGRLAMISIQGRSRFIVYHALTHKAVTCKFEAEKWLTKVKDALGRRVSVQGIVHFNAKREPVRVDVESLRILREKDELPTIAELSGSQPDLTGDSPTDEFIRSIRGG